MLNILHPSQNISGCVPSEREQLKSLVDLRFHENNLQGPFPLEMSNLTHLKILTLSVYKFNSRVICHKDLCLGGVFKIFTASDNYFSGSIPKSLKNCTSLYRVRRDVYISTSGLY
jgi:hypothetical protein